MKNNNKSQFFNNRKAIKKWLDKYNIKNYTINDDLSVDVDGSINSISYHDLKTIPVKFGNVTGDFNCHYNKLTSLIGSPETVGGHFWCQYNKLISLDGSPKSVGRDFYCVSNKLTNLDSSPEIVGEVFDCRDNPLTSLFGIFGCHFKGSFLFSIDKSNFKQKELIQILKKYYNSQFNFCVLSNNEFHDTIKPRIEKEILQKYFGRSGFNTKTKKIFI